MKHNHHPIMPAPQPPPPASFLAKMERLLGDEYAAFVQSYQDAAHIGLRVNTLKISPADFISISPFALEAIGTVEPAGFRLVHEDQPGRHSFHAAGLYYLQEPSAMIAAALLDPQPGELVLDLAAAPGGKSTHLAARMNDTGLLVANDVNRGRAQILAENLERWGVRSALVTNNTPEQLAAAFGSIFDRVLLDAPCSGEGMFRKQGGFEWSEAIVAACARRQSHIITSAAQLVRPGGFLAYTTCTFSPEEDEAVIGRFLAERPDFELVTLPDFAGFSHGKPAWGGGQPDLAWTVRLWPHHFGGEGHFIALLRRVNGPETPRNPIPQKDRVPQDSFRLWQAFAQNRLRVNFSEERMVLVNGRYLTHLPAIQLNTTGLHVIRHGLTLGELRKGRFKPAHALALSLAADEITTTINFPAGAPEITAYLTGHPLSLTPEITRMPGDWQLITVAGYGLGWAKIAGGRLQNHYPRGLRWP